MIIILSFLLLILCIILYRIEKNDNYILSPIFLIGIPYSLLLIYSSVFGYKLYDKQISLYVIILSYIYLSLFFLTGRIVKSIYMKPKISKYNHVDNLCNKKITFLKNRNIYIFVIIMFILIILYKYFDTFKGKTSFIYNLINIKSEFSHGIIAHIINILSIILLVIFCDEIKRNNVQSIKNKKTLIIYFMIFIWIIFLLFATAKYKLMMFISSIFIIYGNCFLKKLSIYKIVLVSIVFPISFILVYILRFISSEGDISINNIIFIIEHLNHYIMSPFYAFSKVLENSLSGDLGLSIIFSPIMNLISIFTNDGFTTTTSQFIEIGNGKATNVFTMLGSIYYEMGFIYSIVFIVLLSMLTYYLYLKLILNLGNISEVSYAYIGSSLTISFFNSFYGTLSFWESIFILFIINKLEKFKIRW